MQDAANVYLRIILLSKNKNKTNYVMVNTDLFFFTNEILVQSMVCLLRTLRYVLVYPW